MTTWLGSLVLVVVACGPSSSRPPTLVRDPMPRDTLATAVHDAGKLHVLMRDAPVMNGGVQFDDATCEASFGAAGEVPAERTAAFASCLAGLHLDVSPRASALADVVVLRYAPGFELEARVIHSPAGPQLTWIGFSARRNGDLDVPTITHDALESLRLAGDRNGPIDPAATADFELDSNSLSKAAFTWLKVCLDESGAIVKHDVYETTSSPASKAFVTATSSWKFRPFVTRGQPRPVCAMVRLAYPADQAPRTETLPLPPPPSKSNQIPVVLANGSMIMERRLVSGEKMLVPDDLTKVEISEARGRSTVSIVGMFRVCVDVQGRVESVLPIQLTGFAAYDQKLIRKLHDWVYKPYLLDGQPVAVCSYVRIRYTQS